jgi:hypothetical protein
MRAYRILWSNGQPHIEAGQIVQVGSKKRIRRITWPSEKKTRPFSSGAESIRKALEAEILDVAAHYGRNIFQRVHKEAPWMMLDCMRKLMRLRDRLQAHNLLQR